MRQRRAGQAPGGPESESTSEPGSDLDSEPDAGNGAPEPLSLRSSYLKAGELAARLSELPPGDIESFYGSPGWFANFAAACLEPHESCRIDAVDGEDGQQVLFVLRERSDPFGPFRGRLLASLTNFYSCQFAPAGLQAAADPDRIVAAWGAALRAGPARPDRVRFESLDFGSVAYDALARGLRQAGYLVECYPQFVNWHLPIGDGGFDGYWAGRAPRLRNTVARKEKALRRQHQVSVETIRDPADGERAAAAYEKVHAASWKPVEPYPAFMPGLIRTGLGDGTVTVGLLRVDGEPASAQVWVTFRRRATIFKLSYAERFKPFSIGSIHTRHMMEQAFASGALDEIDFGWGDHAYKRDWLPQRRERWGILAYEPRSLRGLGSAGRRLLPLGIRTALGRP